MDRYLVVLLGLVALAGLVVVLPLHTTESAPTTPLHELPARAGNWSASASGSGSSPLAYDPRASESLDRIYTDGHSTVAVWVTRYPSRNDPRTRPAFHHIARTQGAGRVVYDAVRVNLNGVVGHPLSLNRVSVRGQGRQGVSVIYWYQLGQRVITNEYELRLRMFLDTLLRRNRSVVLVRLVASQPQALEPFLLASFPHLIRL